MAQFFCSPQLHQFKFQGIGICFQQMWGFGPSADPQPCRCLFHITPLIPNIAISLGPFFNPVLIKNHSPRCLHH